MQYYFKFETQPESVFLFRIIKNVQLKIFAIYKNRNLAVRLLHQVKIFPIFLLARANWTNYTTERYIFLKTHRLFHPMSNH